MFWEILPLIAALSTPLWGYFLWRRMKYVQRLANATAKPRERHGITPVEDTVKTEDGLTVIKPLSYDDDLALATEDANQKSIFKDLEGRKH
jgi:hypothetical protein